jgi:hypothetical protein
MIGGFNVLGSLFFGWAGQRWNKLALLGGIYILRSLALAWYFMLPGRDGRSCPVADFKLVEFFIPPSAAVMGVRYP